MKRLVLVSLAVASLALACTEKGRSVVLVNLTAADNVTGVEEVQVHVVGQDGVSIRHAQGGRPPVKLGVYLDKSISGAVVVQACGFTMAHELIAASAPIRGKTVAPGDTIGPLNAELVADPTASPVCGATGGAGGGGSSGGSGGAAGTGGSAGGAGGTAGAGGSVAGAGGAAGTGGSVVGTGGVAGTGGSVAGAGGGAGSAAGRGGSGGSGGTAGTGGGAGRGGSGGTAGSGGTGGSSGFDWRGAVVVSGDPVAETRPSVAVDFSGNAVVVMEHGGQIWFNRYVAAQSMWTGQAVLAAPPAGVTYAQPIVAVDGSRRYTVVWGPGTNGSGIWQSTSADGGLNWSGAAELHTNTNLAYAPVLAVNSDGAAIVAWNERLPGNPQQVLARVRATNGTWMGMEVLMPGTDANDRRPAVAMSGVGEAFVTWEQPDGTVGMNGIWFRKYGTAGWDAALPLESFDAGPAYAPAVAANPAGNAIVSYLQRTSAIGGNAQLWARRYTGASWGTSLKVAEAVNIDSTQPPSVTLDSSGTATVAFGVDVGSRYNVFTSRQGQSETAWPTSPSAMETDNTAAEDSAGGFAATARATLPVVRSDGSGGVVLIWRKRVGPPGFVRFDLFSRRFSAGTWGAAQMIETLDTGATPNDPASVFAPTLGINGSGLAVASWYYGGTNVSLDVYASVFR